MGSLVKKKKSAPSALRKRGGTVSREAKKRPSRLTAAQLRRISTELATQFPAAVDDDTLRLVLLDVDPHMLHAYWNIPLRSLPLKAPEGEKRLRVYVLPTENASVHQARSWFDVPVQGLRSQQYIDVSYDNAVYAVQYGIAAPSGRFVPLATSRAVRTPPAGRAPLPRPAIPERHRLQHDTASTVSSPTEANRDGERRGVSQVPRPAVLLDEEYIDALVRQRLQLDYDPLRSPERMPIHFSNHEPSESHPSSVPSLSFIKTTAPAALSAALVIEGRVRQGTRVLLHGAEIPVAMDGSFRIRQPLAVDETLYRLLSSAPRESGEKTEDTPVLMTVVSALDKEQVQCEMFAALEVYGSAEHGDFFARFMQDVVTLPDGRLYLKRLLPRGACILPELLLAVQPCKDGA